MIDETAPLVPPQHPSFTQALRYWLKLGCISFGGPAGQIAIMQAELVEKRRWISQGRFLHALNYCMVLPGPEAQQLATYLGYLLHGVKGGVAAGLLFVLPSLLLLAGLSWAYLALGTQVSATLLYGVKPAVVAIVLFAAWRIGSKTLKQPLLWGIAAASFVAIALRLPYPAVIALAAATGWLLRQRIAAGSAHGARKAAASHAPAVLDDHTPTPEHAKVNAARLARIAASGLLLLALVAALLWFTPLRVTVLPTMAVFFTKAALITFGGAYAVMPYVFHSAVDTYGWITAPQMLDGLALGETTPGPLIMVVAFIGSVGAATHAAGFVPWQMGLLGAGVAAFFTFLPSFLFILLGAPFVERSRGNLPLAAPLTAVTAAVVAAIVHLALTLAVQVFNPASGFDGFALLLAALGLLALMRNWLGIIGLIALSAALGLGWVWLAA